MEFLREFASAVLYNRPFEWLQPARGRGTNVLARAFYLARRTAVWRKMLIGPIGV